MWMYILMGPPDGGTFSPDTPEHVTDDRLLAEKWAEADGYSYMKVTTLSRLPDSHKELVRKSRTRQKSSMSFGKPVPFKPSAQPEKPLEPLKEL